MGAQIGSWRIGDLNQSWLAQAQTRHSWLKKVPEKQLGKQLGYVTLGGFFFFFFCKFFLATIKASLISEGRLQV